LAGVTKEREYPARKNNSSACAVSVERPVNVAKLFIAAIKLVDWEPNTALLQVIIGCI
jgi:hypothetical protein